MDHLHQRIIGELDAQISGMRLATGLGPLALGLSRRQQKTGSQDVLAHHMSFRPRLPHPGLVESESSGVGRFSRVLAMPLKTDQLATFRLRVRSAATTRQKGWKPDQNNWGCRANNFCIFNEPLIQSWVLAES